jgi:predicted alpha/beta hydrolase
MKPNERLAHAALQPLDAALPPAAAAGAPAAAANGGVAGDARGMAGAPAAEPEPHVLAAADGYPLAALRYRPPAAVARRALLVVAGATGVPQRFYRRFALHAAQRGFDTWTLDYRGIGASRPSGGLRGFAMRYLDWAHYDLACAVDAAAREGDAAAQTAARATPLVLVGHSFGGHAFGLLPNHARVAAFYTFATGAGWHGWMPRAEQWRVQAMWKLVGPALVRWKGYLPWSLLGMGEDLPLGVYRDWRHWCRFPRYFFDDPEVGAAMAERFARVRTPIVAANALDDAWAPPASRDAFMAGYANAPVERIDLDPRALGRGPIGHMGYFRAQAEPLWQAALARLLELAAGHGRGETVHAERQTPPEPQ